MLRVECPDCGEIIELSERTRVGSRVVCVECGVELEVLSLYPLEVDYALEDDWDEDWADDEWDEEYEEEEEEEEDDWDEK